MKNQNEQVDCLKTERRIQKKRAKHKLDRTKERGIRKEITGWKRGFRIQFRVFWSDPVFDPLIYGSLSVFKI